MVTVNIGKTFLKVYNAKYNKSYSVQEFFENEYFQLFFNHPKYMQWVTNSPFVQMKKGQKVENLTENERIEKLNELYNKINSGVKDASVAIGFAAAELSATTSGLVTDLVIKSSVDDIYYSWIGGSLSIGIGEYSILFNQEDILLQLYDGWKVYRDYLNDRSIDLLGNKVMSWNGQWLNYVNSKYYTEDFDFNSLSNEGFFKLKDNFIEINSVSWSRLFFNLSNSYSDMSVIGYLYSLGQTNKTMGFYPFYFNQARTIRNFYKKLFGEQAAINDAKGYEALYGMKIEIACQLGSFGMQSLEPAGLRDYYANDKSISFARRKSEDDEKYRKRSEENNLKFRTYKTWLLAMITKNKDELLGYSTTVAEALHRYRSGAKGTERINLIKGDLLGAKSRRAFLDALVTVVESIAVNDEENNADLLLFKELRDRAYLMNNEDFGYFIVLLKFDFAILDK